MSYPSKSKPISYSDSIRAFNSQDVQDDINDACGKLAHAMSTIVQKFDSITKQMHTIDLMRLNAPLKPKWDSMRKDLTDLLWQFRTNSGVISGRLKLFCTQVLPMAARNLDGRSGRGTYYYNENVQVLQSYMNISAEHAAITMALAERSVQLSASFISFLTELTALSSRHAVSGQKEMCDVSQRLSELGSTVQQLLATSREMSTTDVTYLVFASSRIVCASGSTGRSKLTRRPIILEGELTNIGRAYDQTDRKRNEVAHAQYAAQLRQDRTNCLSITQTMLSAFVLDQILTSESGLSLFLSIWARLRADCNDIYHWIRNPGQTAIPTVISCYMENGSTVYTSLANSLDVYAAGVDPSLYTPDRDTR